jgi:hypothetical protein
MNKVGYDAEEDENNMESSREDDLQLGAAPEVYSLHISFSSL